MRILHVIHQFYPEHVGGTEAHTRSLARAQAASGHEVSIFSRRFGDGRSVTEEPMDGFRVVRAVDGPFSAGRRFADVLHQPFLAAALNDTIARAAPEIVHVQHVMGLPARALADTPPGTAMVATLHDYFWICANAQLYTGYGDKVCGGPRAWLNCARCGLARFGLGGLWPAAPFVAPVFAARERSLRRLGGRVDAWIAPTRFVRDWHVARGWPPDRTAVVAHGIDPPPVDAVRVAAQRPAGRGAVRFAYLGGLSIQKGVHVLVEAFRALPAHARLTVAGDESVFPAYCAGLRTRATHPGIEFVGLLSHKDVWRTLAAVDVLVVPSVWYETSSLIAQEALAIGTPVVTTDHGALAERVQHESTGLRVPPGDAAALRAAMTRLMEDPGLLRDLRSHRAPIRTTAEAAVDIEAAYRRAIAESRRAARGA